MARIKVKKTAFFFFFFWRSSSTKCWLIWVSGILGVGLFQFGRDICLLYSVPEPGSVQGHDNQERPQLGPAFEPNLIQITLWGLGRAILTSAHLSGFGTREGWMMFSRAYVWTTAQSGFAEPPDPLSFGVSLVV